MTRSLWLFIALIVVLSGSAVAQVFLQPVSLADVQSNSVAVGYFHKTPTVTTWNFPRGVKVSGRTMTVDVQAAVQDPDLGVAMSPNGVEIGTLAARPTCTATYRGMYFTQFTANNGGNSDGGIKDITYQCCKTTATPATYAWLAGYCQ